MLKMACGMAVMTVCRTAIRLSKKGECAMHRLTLVNVEKGRENHQLPAWAEITQAWGGWSGLFIGKIGETPRPSVNSIEILMLAGRKWGSQRGRRASVLGVTVSVTGFSVAQTGFSVAQSLKTLPDFCLPLYVRLSR